MPTSDRRGGCLQRLRAWTSSPDNCRSRANQKLTTTPETPVDGSSRRLHEKEGSEIDLLGRCQRDACSRRFAVSASHCAIFSSFAA